MVWGPRCHSGEGTDARLGLPREGGNLLKASDLASQGQSQAAGPRLSQAVPGIIWVVLGRGWGGGAAGLESCSSCQDGRPPGFVTGPPTRCPKVGKGVRLIWLLLGGCRPGD